MRLERVFALLLTCGSVFGCAEEGDSNMDATRGSEATGESVASAAQAWDENYALGDDNYCWWDYAPSYADDIRSTDRGNGKTLYLCRTEYPGQSGHWHPGKLYNGKCRFEYGGKIYLAPTPDNGYVQYMRKASGCQYPAGTGSTTTPFVWRTITEANVSTITQGNGAVGGVSSSGEIMGICESIADNDDGYWHPGKWSGGKCWYEQGGYRRNRVVPPNGYDKLRVLFHTTPAPGDDVAG